jgi:hypothetical protein
MIVKVVQRFSDEPIVEIESCSIMMINIIAQMHGALSSQQVLDRLCRFEAITTPYHVYSRVPIEPVEVLDMMSREGGHFVQSLAEAWRRADESNATRLLAAFPDVYARYELIAAKEKS